MALFGLSDISFDKGTSSRKGPLAALVGNEFATTTLKYPLDIGNADKAHYMVFTLKHKKQHNSSLLRQEISPLKIMHNRVQLTQLVA